MWDVSRTLTALGWFEDFIVATQREPFIPAQGPYAISGALYNRETLNAFGTFVRRSTPKGATKRENVSSDAIAGYQSAIYVLRCREAKYDVSPVYADQISSGVRKKWRKEDGSTGNAR